MTTRVLIVDDQALVRAGFRMILETQPDIEVVGEGADGAEAIESVDRLAPDVVLMDIRMAAMDGIAATREITGRQRPSSGSAVRIIMLTTYDLDEYVFEALQAGASGFLLKDVPPEELVHAVRVVADGEALLSPSATRRLIAEFVDQGGARGEAPVVGHRLDSLTRREREVLEMMARGLSNPEIAAEAYVSENTVKTHVARVFDKLGVRDRVQAVIVAYDAGLVARAGERPAAEARRTR
jgi:DNA-binding NarL/FixJ family response regulator